MPNHNPNGTGALSLETLARFGMAWRRGTHLLPDELLPQAPTPSAADPARRALLEALVQIDLEYRWRGKPTTGQPWALEESSRRYPELAPAGQWSLELIGEEYRVRQRWGDRPAHA